MAKLLIVLTLLSALSACSSAGGLYKADDPEHSEFSAGKTILSVIGAIGAAVIIKNGSNYGDYYDPYLYGPVDFTK